MTSHGFIAVRAREAMRNSAPARRDVRKLREADAIHQRADEISLVIVLSLRGEGRSMLMEAKACAAGGAPVCKRNADF